MRTQVLSILLPAAVLLASCGGDRAPQRHMGPTLVNAVEVPTRTVTSYASYPASMEGVVSSAIRPKVSGYITQVNVDEGQAVKEGDVLFRLETASLSEDAEAAMANVNAAEVEVARLRPLVDKGIVSEVQLQTAEARLSQAKATHKSIVANIGYATVRSSISGNVGSINYREGALVSPADPTPLTTVSKVDDIYVFFAMNEGEYIDILRTTPGEKLSDKINNFPEVRLRLINGDIYPHAGRIETVTGQVDPRTGTVSFRAVFPNPERLLSHGGSGTVLIPRTYEDVPVIPESATIDRQGRIFVYAVHGDTTAVSKSIEVKDRIDGLIVVGDGLKPGDVIVARGSQNLRDHAAVNVVMLPLDSIVGAIEPVFKQ